MKMKKLIIGSVLAVAVACTAGAFAACGGDVDDDSSKTAAEPAGKTVVAEGTGYAEWGQGCYVLYQEYSDGTVFITGAWTDYDYSTGGSSGNVMMLQEFNGSIEKGVDEDGDPYVKLTVTDYVLTDLNHTPLTGAAYEEAGMVGTVTYDYDAFTSNTYNTTTGEYTIGFAINEFGYYKLEYSIQVTSVTTATDVDAWVASVNTGSSASTDDGSGNAEGENNITASTFTNENGTATLTDGWMTLELTSEGNFTATNLVSSLGYGQPDTITASGTWSISNSIVTLNNTLEGATEATITAAEAEASDGTTVYGLELPGYYGGTSSLYYTSDNASALSSLLSNAQ